MMGGRLGMAGGVLALVALVGFGAVEPPAEIGSGARDRAGAYEPFLSDGDVEVRRRADGVCRLDAGDGRELEGRAPACLRAFAQGYGAQARIVLLVGARDTAPAALDAVEARLRDGGVAVRFARAGSLFDRSGPIARLREVLEAFAGAGRLDLVAWRDGAGLAAAALAETPRPGVGRAVLVDPVGDAAAAIRAAGVEMAVVVPRARRGAGSAPEVGAPYGPEAARAIGGFLEGVGFPQPGPDAFAPPD